MPESDSHAQHPILSLSLWNLLCLQLHTCGRVQILDGCNIHLSFSQQKLEAWSTCSKPLVHERLSKYGVDKATCEASVTQSCKAELTYLNRRSSYESSVHSTPAPAWVTAHSFGKDIEANIDWTRFHCQHEVMKTRNREALFGPTDDKSCTIWKSTTYDLMHRSDACPRSCHTSFSKRMHWKWLP